MGKISSPSCDWLWSGQLKHDVSWADAAAVWLHMIASLTHACTPSGWLLWSPPARPPPRVARPPRERGAAASVPVNILAAALSDSLGVLGGAQLPGRLQALGAGQDGVLEAGHEDLGHLQHPAVSRVAVPSAQARLDLKVLGCSARTRQQALHLRFATAPKSSGECMARDTDDHPEGWKL